MKLTGFEDARTQYALKQGAIKEGSERRAELAALLVAAGNEHRKPKAVA